MGTISPSQSSDGQTIEAADVNGPINTIANEVNGNLDANNFADSAVTTAKVADDAITPAKWTNPYCFSVRLSADQTAIADTTWTVVEFDTEDFDLNSNFNTTTYTYTVPVSGVYLFTMDPYVDSTASLPELAWVLMGVEINASGEGNPLITSIRVDTDYYGDRLHASGAKLVQLTAGDTVRAMIYVNTSPSKTADLKAATSYSHWTGALVHAT